MAFHPYPQRIPAVFNLRGFAPPQSLTLASHWPWVDHPASGPEHATNTHFRIRFPSSYLQQIVNYKRHAADSQAHSSKGTPSPQKKALTDCQHTVSGTISLPSRGTFHHSLTVLHTLSVTTSYQTYRTVPADSQQIPRAHCYSGTPRTPKHTHFTYRTLTLSGRRFHTTSATHMLKAGRKRLTTHADPTTPHTTPQPRL